MRLWGARPRPRPDMHAGPHRHGVGFGKRPAVRVTVRPSAVRWIERSDHLIGGAGLPEVRSGGFDRHISEGHCGTHHDPGRQSHRLFVDRKLRTVVHATRAVGKTCTDKEVTPRESL